MCKSVVSVVLVAKSELLSDRMLWHCVTGQAVIALCESCCSVVHTGTVQPHSITAMPTESLVIILNTDIADC